MFRSKLQDLLLALLVLLVTLMLLVPLDTRLLDLLLTLNLGFSLLLLLVGLYLQDALSLLSFPSILLLTTLYRLSLNVASSRLILSQGDAGQIIEAFGSLLIGGEIAVGIIIFSVITIVNFIVIARGSARVSEVAARFALDALPGKQLAIDADLRAGLLSLEEAREKREDLRRESQLYGAMDGAMKFVQGDAIAGFFIILTNMIGGMYMGLHHGLSVGDAVETYVRLTIGDGLVSQIPAILISVCAGVVVTRISSGENTTLASDVAGQLFDRPVLFIMVGVLMCAAALIEGIPVTFFLLVGLVFCVVGVWRYSTLNHVGLINFVKGEFSAPVPAVLPPPDDRQEEAAIELFLDKWVLFEQYRQVAGDQQGWWNQFQSNFYNQLGVQIPRLAVRGESSLVPGEYRVALDGVEVLSGSIPSNSILIEVNPSHARALGFSVVKELHHPFNGALVCWIEDSAVVREMLLSARIRFWHFFQWICFSITIFLNHNPEELVTLTDVHYLVKGLEKRYPGFVGDTVDRALVDMPLITQLLQQSIRSGLGVRDFKMILEILATYCSLQRIGSAEELDLGHLLSFMRVTRKRHLLKTVVSARQTAKVIVLGDETQEVFLAMGFDGHSRSPSAIEPDKLDSLLNSYEALVNPIRDRGLLPVSVLCPSELRNRVERVLRGINCVESVLSFEELDPFINIEPVGIWRV